MLYKRFGRRVVFKVPFRKCHLRLEFPVCSSRMTSALLSSENQARKKNQVIFSRNSFWRVCLRESHLPLLAGVPVEGSWKTSCKDDCLAPYWRVVVAGGASKVSYDLSCYDSRTNRTQLVKWNDSNYHLLGTFCVLGSVPRS